MQNHIKNMNAIIGQKIKARRQEMHLTQKDLAKSLNCTFQQIQKYESGQNKISISKLFDICDVLKCSPNYFLEHLNLSESYDAIDSILETQLLMLFRQLKTTEVKKEALKVLKLILDIQGLFK